MLKYKIAPAGKKRRLPEVVFEDSYYSLFAELLLAERSFLDKIVEAFESGEENPSFSGNAFSIFITPENTKVTNDINGEEIEAPTRDLKRITKAYKKQYDKVQR